MLLYNMYQTFDPDSNWNIQSVLYIEPLSEMSKLAIMILETIAQQKAHISLRKCKRSF